VIVCWDYLQLGTPSDVIANENTEELRRLEEQVNDLRVKEKMVAGAVISAA
jgi:hypothetical protein